MWNTAVPRFCRIWVSFTAGLNLDGTVGAGDIEGRYFDFDDEDEE